MKRPPRSRAVALAGVAALCSLAAAGPSVPAGGAGRRQSAKTAAPAVGRAAPEFTLSDAGGKNRTPLREFRGRRVALFFFCGCTWCADIAAQWGALQRAGALAVPAAGPRGKKPVGTERPPPVTVVVYEGLDAQRARGLAAATALSPRDTIVLPDPAAAVTRRTYGVDPCPRVFVVDARGVLRYTNGRRPDDRPREALAAAIVAHVLDALRRP